MATTNGHPKVVSPTKLAHVVLRTNQMDKMMDWYTTFLGGRVVHSNPMIGFMTYDDEHHRIAFINMPDMPDKVRHSAGLEHIAFTFDSLADLLTAYRQRLAQPQPIKPVWCVNHGITTSLYYKDPDGNLLGEFLALGPPPHRVSFLWWPDRHILTPPFPSRLLHCHD